MDNEVGGKPGSIELKASEDETVDDKEDSELSNSSNAKPRVKIYVLNENDGNWVDKGTGLVEFTHLQKYDSVGIIVRLETNPDEVIFCCKIYHEDIYTRQRDTIITWQDPETQHELALSFADAKGCADVWDHICSIQGLTVAEEIEFPPSAPDVDGGDADSDILLPPIELANLDKIHKVLSETVKPTNRAALAALVIKENAIPKILQLFSMMSDLEDADSLKMIYRVLVDIILLNDAAVFDTLFSDEYILEVIGALQNDPDYPYHNINHRQYVIEQAKFKEVIPIKDPEMVAKIHQTYRISYLKDVVLPRALDDVTFASFNSILYFNNLDIVNYIANDSEFLHELFVRLKNKTLSQEDRKELMLFVQELCNLAKNLQAAPHREFYLALQSQGLLDIMEQHLNSSDESIRQLTCDVITV